MAGKKVEKQLGLALDGGVECTLYGQHQRLSPEMINILANLGHLVSIKDAKGNFVEVKKREIAAEPLKIPQDNPEVVEFFVRRKALNQENNANG